MLLFLAEPGTLEPGPDRRVRKKGVTINVSASGQLCLSDLFSYFSDESLFGEHSESVGLIRTEAGGGIYHLLVSIDNAA